MQILTTVKVVKWILIVELALVAILAGSGLFLPASVHVERSIMIEAQPAEIFPYVNNYRKFYEWSPWALDAPDTEYTFSGPEEGVGAKVTWHSKDEEDGSGSHEIIESTPNEKVVIALILDDEGTAHVQTSFRLQPEGTGTKVIWSYDTAETGNPFARWFFLLLDMQASADHKEGLERLKEKVETGAV